MKIVFFARRFWPEIGGVENHCFQVGKILIKKGYKLVVVSETLAKSGLNQEEEIEGIRVYRIPLEGNNKDKKYEIWRWLFNNRHLIKDADLVHCHDVFYWYFPFRFFYPQKKVFVTFHGWEGIFPPEPKAKVIRKLSELLSLDNICVGNYIKKWYKTNPSIVTYGAVKRDLGEKKKTTDILYVGRLEKDTGLPIYLKTLSSLKGDITVNFLGDGALRGEAEKFGRVLGFVSDVQSHIKGARLIFTSGYMAILEALINKKPVVSVYDNMLKKDYLEMAPFKDWITIAEKPEILSKIVRDYLDNKKYNQTNINLAYNWAKKQTWEKLTEEYIKLWEI